MNTTFRRTFLLLLPLTLITSTMLTGGCESEPAPGSPAEATGDVGAPPAAASGSAETQIGVLDIDQAAKELGLADQYRQIVTGQQQQLQDQMNAMQMSFRANLEKRQQALGDEPTDEQRQELQQYQMQGVQKLRNLQSQAQAQSAQLRGSLGQQVQKMIRGPAEKVAQQRGLKIVFLKLNDIFYTAKGVDITDAVVELAKKEGVTKIDTESLALDTKPTPQPDQPVLGDDAADVQPPANGVEEKEQSFDELFEEPSP